MNNLLITGPPGIGKTTLVEAIIEGTKPLKVKGFFTREIREEWSRKGFKLISISGETSILARVDIASPYRVSKYGIDVDAFELFLDTLDFAAAEVAILDEIGKMECFSDKFITIVRHLLDSEIPLIATIARKGGGFIEEVKCRKDMELVQITRQNRSRLADEIVEKIRNLRNSG